MKYQQHTTTGVNIMKTTKKDANTSWLVKFNNGATMYEYGRDESEVSAYVQKYFKHNGTIKSITRA